jgi:uroporphyrinogen-III decarboxylase
MALTNDIVQTREAKAKFDARWQRILDCVALKQPDRMPVAFYAIFWFAKYGGISCRDLMYDYEKAAAVTEQAILELEPDAVSPVFAGIAIGRILEAVDFKQLQWPGHGVSDNQPFQYLDREYVKVDELIALVRDPSGFYLNTYLPRIMGAFEGFDKFPLLAGTYYLRTITALRPLANPEFRASLKRVLDAADEVDRYMTHVGEWTRRIEALGYPLINGSNTGAPYDVLADYFRGATGMMKDLFRNKDKLHEAINAMRLNILRMTIANAEAAGHPIVFIPIHWAPDAFMSPKQFEEFWWPSFRQMMIDMIDVGLIPLVLWEADCSKRLEIIKDVPPGKCIYWFERTDMIKAYEVLGDVVALRGNLSSSLMTTGTPQQVDAAVRHLVDNVWAKGGNLILDCAFGIPDETPAENVRAMFKAARKYAG